MQDRKPLNRPPNPWLLCIAPMMGCTDRHFRSFARRISSDIRLYTEMVTTGALLHGDRGRFLAHGETEHPLALQLGGSDPGELAECAKLGQQAGFNEINLNVGCPSARVQSGRFGACLMAEPALVAACVSAMRDKVTVPVTVKTRTGIDERDSYDELAEFVHAVEAAGCTAVIVHARKAWLAGLSPHENRELPPLRQDKVYRLKQDFPGLTVVLNGGVANLADARTHLEHVDGVMIGRRAYADPYMLATADRQFFAAPHPVAERAEIVRSLFPYIEQELARGTYLKHITRHLLGLFQGQPGAKQWRRRLSGSAVRNDAGIEVIDTALRDLERCRHSHAA